MKKISLSIALVIVFIISAQCSLFASDPAKLSVDVTAAGKPVASTLHGIFFEDINYAGDGGLYAELVQNRSFEHNNRRYSWSEVAADGAKGRLTVESESPLNANNTHFLRIHVNNSGKNGYGMANSGFGGIVLKSGDKYLFSIYARIRAGKPEPLNISLQDNSGKVLAETKIDGLTDKWQKFEAPLNSPADIGNAKLVVLATGAGVVDVDMVSLFPEKTFKNRRNGLRADLAQALADMKPGFMRFPGGCIVEGTDAANAYRWKDTIGDIAERKQNRDLWQDGNSPQYYQTYGLGFFEFFQFCEDIGAEPVPVLNCGMMCQARRGVHIPLEELGPWVQDALDLIEFANGPATGTWGSRRAAMGHPEPFNMKVIGVGNEQWNQEYFDRYPIFYEAIKKKYPDIKIITTAGPFVNDQLWRFAWNKFKSGTPADIVDEHYYVPPKWLLENVDRYSEYDPNGPKVFVGEYASHDGQAKKNNFRAAVTEAAYITGLLKYSDVVAMASYAPLLSKFGNDQWHPDLIWFDNSRVVLTPSYHVQALYSQNRPDISLPVKVESPMRKEKPLKGMIGLGTYNTQSEYKDIVVTAPDGKVLFKSDFSNGMDGWKTYGGKWETVDGALRQNANGQDVSALAGDPSWTNYTLTLRARKLGGDEGFFILFHTTDPNDQLRWNIGGWGNTEHSFQGGGLAERHVPGSIETNRWYDIRIELEDGSVKAFLDGKLIQEAKSSSLPTLYASAGRDKKTGELILHVVNVSLEACETEVSLNGVKKLTAQAKGIELGSANMEDENTLENPAKITPKTISPTIDEPNFKYTFPAQSFTLLRLKAE